MTKKKILLISLVTLLFFLIFVKPWGEDYYFPVLLLVVYFSSSFVKSGIIKYYSLICILTILVIFQESWFIDHIIPLLLGMLIISDVLYQLINLIQSRIFKKFEYKLVNLLIPIFPILLTITLFFIETNNLNQIKLKLPSNYVNLLIMCETTGECSKKVWLKKKVTKGITTVQLRYLFKNNCLHVNPSKNWVNINYYNSCKKD